MITKEDNKLLISEAYSKAALSDHGDMRMAADLFESVKPQLISTSPFEAWEYLMLDAVKFNNEEGLNLLLLLREVYFKTYIKKQLDLLEEAAGTNRAELEKTWTKLFANAAVHLRDEVVCMLCHERLRWDKDVEKDLRLVRYIRENRWVDAYPYFVEIANNPHLDNHTRVLAEILLTEIILYWYPEATNATQHLQNAAEIEPDSPIIIRGWGEVYLKNGDIERARNSFLEVIGTQPSNYIALNLIGDCFLAEGSLENAESWYYNAIKINFLQTESYRRLINLYANKKWFSEKELHFFDLLDKITKRPPFTYVDEREISNIATPDCFQASETYHTYRDIGSAWFTNDNMQEAEQWYKKAIDHRPSFITGILDLAYLKLQLNEIDSAKEIFYQALQQDNESYDVYWGLAYFYQEQGNKEEALKAYQKCLALRPFWSDRINNFIGNVYYYHKEYEKAASYYREALKNMDNLVYRQNLADALRLSADAYANNGEDDKAEANYISAANIDGTAENWNILGNFYYKKQHWESAIEHYNKAIALKDTEPVYFENRGLAFEKLELNDEAEKSFIKAADLESDSGRFYNRLGNYYFKRREYEKAIDNYEKSLKREPDELIYHDNICRAYEESNQRDKAEPHYLQIIKQEPENDTVLHLLAFMYYQRNDLEKAENYEKMAIKANDKVAYYHSTLAQILRNKDKHQESLLAIEAALNLDPANDINWNYAGVLYYDIHNYEKALQYYSKALEINPGIAVYHENIGLVYEKMSQYGKAIDFYKQALEITPTNGRLYNSIGLNYYYQQQYDQAIEYYTKAVETGEENWIFYTNLGLALRVAGFDDKAIDAYTKAVGINEHNYLTWEELGDLYKKKNYLVEAESCYRKAIDLKPNDPLLISKVLDVLNEQGKHDEAKQVHVNLKATKEVKAEAKSLIQMKKEESKPGKDAGDILFR